VRHEHDLHEDRPRPLQGLPAAGQHAHLAALDVDLHDGDIPVTDDLVERLHRHLQLLRRDPEVPAGVVELAGLRPRAVQRGRRVDRRDVHGRRARLACQRGRHDRDPGMRAEPCAQHLQRDGRRLDRDHLRARRDVQHRLDERALVRADVDDERAVQGEVRRQHVQPRDARPAGVEQRGARQAAALEHAPRLDRLAQRHRRERLPEPADATGGGQEGLQAVRT
jgi:hypothetical protein